MDARKFLDTYTLSPVLAGLQCGQILGKQAFHTELGRALGQYSKVRQPRGWQSLKLSCEPVREKTEKEPLAVQIKHLFDKDGRCSKVGIKCVQGPASNSVLLPSQGSSAEM